MFETLLVNFAYHFLAEDFLAAGFFAPQGASFFATAFLGDGFFTASFLGVAFFSAFLATDFFSLVSVFFAIGLFPWAGIVLATGFFSVMTVFLAVVFFAFLGVVFLGVVVLDFVVFGVDSLSTLTSLKDPAPLPDSLAFLRTPLATPALRERRT